MKKVICKLSSLLVIVLLMIIGLTGLSIGAWDDYKTAPEIKVGTTLYKVGSTRYFRFIPEEDDLYNFYMDIGNSCICGDCECEVQVYDYDFEDVLFVNGFYEMKKGETYYLFLDSWFECNFSECNFVVENYKPAAVENFSVSKVTDSSVTLVWDEIDYVDGYVVYSYDSDMKTRKEVKRVVGADTTKVTINELKSDSEYIFAIESFDDIGLGSKYSDISEFTVAYTNPDMSSINSKISKGYFADISHNNIDIDGKVYTDLNEEGRVFVPIFKVGYNPENKFSYYGKCDYGSVSDITHFFDYKGMYTIVYESNGYIFFDRYDDVLKKVSTMKIKTQYPLFGDALTDKDGNYYVVWGAEDSTMNGGIVTMAVSKYSYSGKYIATAKYKTKGGIESWDTRSPFAWGNCDTIIDSRGVLICNYGREMYNGHQSNDILCVDTVTMKQIEKYGNYVSHDFDQKVLELDDGSICFVNKGDAYPRAFDVEIFGSEHKRYQPFHFYGEGGYYRVYSWLGGVAEASKNLFLVASAAKSMTSACEKENYSLFIQLMDDERTIKDSATRKGTSDGDSFTDKGVKWLTDYASEYTVANPQVVEIDKERFVVLWEKIKRSGESTKFVQSYYMVMSADGMVIQDATPMCKTRLTSHEDPIYRDGYIYWTTGNGSECVIHKLKVGSVVNKFPTPKVTSVKNVSDGVTVTWEPVIGTDKYRVLRKTPDGEWKKVKDTTATTFTDKTVENSKEYLYTVKCVSSNGKKNLSDYDKTGVKIYRLKPTTLKAQVKQKTVSLTWSKISKSTGYEIEYSTDKNFKKNNKTVTLKGASKISQSIKNLSAGKTYYFRVRSYKKLSGKTYYATWSKTTKIKISG